MFLHEIKNSFFSEGILIVYRFTFFNFIYRMGQTVPNLALLILIISNFCGCRAKINN